MLDLEIENCSSNEPICPITVIAGTAAIPVWVRTVKLDAVPMKGATAEPTDRLAGRAKQRGKAATARAKESILKV